MRSDSAFVELMHEEIDGVISGDRQALLHRILDEDPEAREQFRALRELCAALDVAGQDEPPVDLKTNVLESLRSRVTEERARFTARIPGRSQRIHVVLRYGYVAAAGVLLGIAVDHLALSSGPERRGIAPSDLIGTTAHHASGTSAAIVQEIPISFPGGTGRATVWKGEQGFTVEFDLAAGSRVGVTLRYDPQAMLLRGFAQDPPAAGDLDVENARIAWTQTGQHRLAVLMAPRTQAASAIDLEIDAPGSPASKLKVTLPGIASE